MGRKTRIILLSITAVLAVVTFIAMLAVRPGTESEVLAAARARQQEPLLSVAEPLETDVRTLTEEERMAEKVKELLLSDEEFIGSVSSSIESVVPEYVTEWVNGEEAASILAELQERGVEEAVSRIVTDENIDRIAETVSSRLGTSDPGAFADATDRIVSIISSSLTIPAVQKSAIENAILAFYESNKEQIASDAIDKAVAEYSALSAEEKSALLGAEDIILLLYDEYGDALADDVIRKAVSEYGSLSDEDKAELLGVRALAAMIYAENRDAVAADILSSIPDEEPVDYDAIFSSLYEENKGVIAEDVIGEAIERYNAMDSGEQAALLRMDSILAALYEANRGYIIEDISKEIMAALPETEEIDAEAVATALYDKYRDYIAEDVISYYLSHYGAPAPASVPAEEEEIPADVTPAKERISAPVFSGEPAVSKDASQEDYNRAREEMRQRELDRLSAFIN